MTHTHTHTRYECMPFSSSRSPWQRTLQWFRLRTREGKSEDVEMGQGEGVRGRSEDVEMGQGEGVRGRSENVEMGDGEGVGKKIGDVESGFEIVPYMESSNLGMRRGVSAINPIAITEEVGTLTVIKEEGVEPRSLDDKADGSLESDDIDDLLE